MHFDTDRADLLATQRELLAPLPRKRCVTATERA